MTERGASLLASGKLPGLQDAVRGTEWDALVRRYELHLSAARQLAPLTVRNYLNDLTPFFEYIRKVKARTLAKVD
ncbi:MAG TPA: site-specific integrase, partial [Candidatus Thermoplasmatota archaeon]